MIQLVIFHQIICYCGLGSKGNALWIGAGAEADIVTSGHEIHARSFYYSMFCFILLSKLQNRFLLDSFQCNYCEFEQFSYHTH